MLLFLTYLKNENICTKRYFTVEKNAGSTSFLTCRSILVKRKYFVMYIL